MIKNLCKHGDDLALVIDRSTLEQLGIDETTPLEISTEGKTLIVSPAQDDERRRKFEEALANVNERYAETLKRLAE
jgi:antitoxin component of MazEF toxin-antitoxin module